MRLVGALALFLVLVVASTPLYSKEVALMLSELPIPASMAGNAQWTPAEQPIEVCYARNHIMPGQKITEKDIITRKVVVKSDDITGDRYPLAKDIVGNKSKTMIFAGGRFSAWNLEGRAYDQREKIGTSANPLYRLQMKHAISQASSKVYPYCNN